MTFFVVVLFVVRKIFHKYLLDIYFGSTFCLLPLYFKKVGFHWELGLYILI